MPGLAREALGILVGTVGATKRILSLRLRMDAGKDRGASRGLATTLFETDRRLVRRQRCRETVVGGGVVKMQQVGGALKQSGREVARLVINPAGSVVE